MISIITILLTYYLINPANLTLNTTVANNLTSATGLIRATNTATGNLESWMFCLVPFAIIIIGLGLKFEGAIVPAGIVASATASVMALFLPQIIGVETQSQLYLFIALTIILSIVYLAEGITRPYG